MRGFNYMECNTLRGVYIDQKLKRNDHISTTIIIGVQFKLEMLWALYHSLRNGIDHYTKDHIKMCCNDLPASQMVDPVTINTIVYNVLIMESKDIKNIKESNDDFVSVICNSYEIFAIGNGIEDGTEIEIKARKLSNNEAKSKFRKYIYIRLNGKCYKVRIKNYSSTSIDDLLTRLSTLIDINESLYKEYDKGFSTTNTDKDKLYVPGLLSDNKLINKDKEDDSKNKSPLYDTISENLDDIINTLEEEETKCYINGNNIDMVDDVDVALLISDCIAYFYKNMDINDLDKYSISAIAINNDLGNIQLMYFLLTDGYDNNRAYKTKELGYKERQLLNDINLAMANFYMKRLKVSEDIVLTPLNSIPYCQLHNDDDKTKGGVVIDDRPKDLPESDHEKMSSNTIKDQLKDILNKIFGGESISSMAGNGNIQVLQGYIDSNGNTKIISNNNDEDNDEDDNIVNDLHKYIINYNDKNKLIEDYNKDIKILDIIAMFFNDVYENNFRFDFIKEQVPRNTIMMINALKEFISTPLRDSIMSHMTNNRFDVNPSMGFFSIFDFKIFDEYILSFVLYYDNDEDKYKITTFYPETCSGFSIREHTLSLRDNEYAKKCSSCIIINSKFGYTILSYNPADILYYLPRNSVNKTIIKDNKTYNILDHVIYTLLSGYIMYMNNVLLNKKNIINDRLFNNDNIINPNFSDIMKFISKCIDNDVLTKVDMIFLIISLRDYINNRYDHNNDESTTIMELKEFHHKDIQDFKEFITYDSTSYNLTTIYDENGYDIYKKGSDYKGIRSLSHPMQFYKDNKVIFSIRSSMNAIKDDETVSNLYKILKFNYIIKYGEFTY